MQKLGAIVLGLLIGAIVDATVTQSLVKHGVPKHTAKAIGGIAGALV